MKNQGGDGGPAFPTGVPYIHNDEQGKDYPMWEATGMTLRDWFAGQALASVLPVYLEQNKCGCAVDHALRNVPALAYKYADAMLAERNT